MDSIIVATARSYFKESIEAKDALINDSQQLSNLVEVAKSCIACYKRGNKILIAGNGGSAGDAQHFAGELVSRLNFDRPPLSAIALTTDTSILTAIGNDYGYENVFSRQLLANAVSGDLYIAISTSGSSLNILNSLNTAKKMNLVSIALTGSNGKKLEKLCDHVICVPSSKTSVIQEAHISIIHLVCGVVEFSLFKELPNV